MLTIQCDTNVAKSLQWLRGKGELCDIIVVGGDGQQTLGHSCVLAAHSTVIAAVLQGRLAAQRDWSVVRPLVISIDDVSIKNQESSSPCKVNMMEALVGLVYGEAVNVSVPHLPTLSKYASLLGLSHHICSSLELSRTKGGAGQLLESTTNTSKANSRRKQSRKPILSKSTDKSDSDEVKQGGQLMEINLTTETVSNKFTTGTSATHHKQPEECILPQTLQGKVDCDSSILELSSMLCSEVQSMDTPSNNSWCLDQCQSKQMTYEQPVNPDTQQHSNVATPALENSKTLETMRDFSEGAVAVKMETVFQTERGNNTNTQSIVQEQDLGSGEDQNGYCNDVQQQKQKQQQKQQQQKQRALGKGLLCGVCSASFQRCGDLVKHVQLSQHFSQQCPLCFIQVRDLEDQRVHFAQHDQELPFFCMYCDLRFRTRTALTMHAPKHSTTRPFVCSDCGRGFKWRHALQAHSYTHSPSTRLLCDICGFSSKYVTSFKAHLVQHSGRSFPCPHPGCAFTSTRKTHLNDHLATHTKTRVHQCEVCGHSFSHAKNMWRHMRLHAPASNLLSCTLYSKIQCSFRTTRLDKLRDHLSKKHNLSQPHNSQEPIAKLFSSTEHLISNDREFMQKTTLEALSGLEEFKTSEASSEFAAIVQEATTPGLQNLEKVNHKERTEEISLLPVEEPQFQNSENLESQLVVHTTVSSNNQGAFSVLVSSPSITGLTESDIQALDHEHQTEKGHRVEEMTDSFSPGFLVEHDILLHKPQEATEVSQSQQLESDASMDDLMTQADKLAIPVNDSLQDQGEFTNHMDPSSYPGFPSQGTSDNVVLEVMAPQPQQPPGTTTNTQQQPPTLHLLHTTSLDKKAVKQEQCIESLNILEFMFDGVTD
ncbi:hypothetical protein Pcinc_009203 [Petrolisthes cinctipes]|uniref:Uncharacterized protein n=1 Tax=Petrolisthes cinctipes TaxID=88211 RepID=A0AAE1G540_PETCI|nr:hypothetical protein Pcinc_009203 [Petrolisthes cinctipes]